jgi:hypothetical protein
MRGKARQAERRKLAKLWLYRLERLAELGLGGRELLPAFDDLEKRTKLRASELARKESEKRELGERVFKLLEDVEDELIASGYSEDEIRRIKVHLEEKMR